MSANSELVFDQSLYLLAAQV